MNQECSAITNDASTTKKVIGPGQPPRGCPIFPDFRKQESRRKENSLDPDASYERPARPNSGHAFPRRPAITPDSGPALTGARWRNTERSRRTWENVAAELISRILSAGLLQQDGHSSGPRIAVRLKRPTRRL